MLGSDSIREQLRREEAAKKALEGEKAASEKKRKQGEEVLNDVNAEKSRAAAELARFESNIDNSIAGAPSRFAQYYKREMSNAINSSGIRQLDDSFTSVSSTLKSSILDLDDAIADFIRRIAQKSTIIQELRNLLQAAVDALKSIMPGGQ